MRNEMSFARDVLRRLMALSGLAVVTLAVALPASAIDNNRAKLKSMSFSIDSVDDLQGGVATIRVISTDGRTWNRVRSSRVWLKSRMRVDTKWPGYVVGVTVRLGSCHGENCEDESILWQKTVVERDYSGSADMSFDTSRLPASASASNSTAAILRRCNDKLQPDGPTKSYRFKHSLYATFTADTAETLNLRFIKSQPGAGGGWWTKLDHTKTDPITVNVICEPMINAPVGDLQHDFGPFRVQSVKLFLTTYQSNQQGANPGTTCPALKVTSRAKANQAGQVTMRIWRQKGNGPITSSVRQATATFDAGQNGYFATVEEFENVGTTSYYQFKTEIVSDDTFNPSDGWKDITVHCSSPGGGGLTDVPQDNPGLPEPQARWQGEVAVADSAGRDKRCPRKGEVSFVATRAVPGKLNYRIQCSNGAFFSGTATGYDKGGGVFEVTGAHDLSVNRTRSISCTLQELQPAPVTLGTGKKDFICKNRNVDPGGDDRLVDTTPDIEDPRPTDCRTKGKRAGRTCGPVSDNGPSDPPRVIVDPPRLACAGGKVVMTARKPVRYECRCPSGRDLKNAGPNRFRCETGATAALTCLNGSVRAGRCVCSPSAKKVQIGPSAWRCQRPKTTPGSGTRDKLPVRTGVPDRHQSGIITRFSQGDDGTRKKRKPKRLPMPDTRKAQ